MTAEQMQQYRALAARNESAVPLCSEYQRAIGALLAEVERLRGELAAEQARPKLEPTEAENEAAVGAVRLVAEPPEKK